MRNWVRIRERLYKDSAVTEQKLEFWVWAARAGFLLPLRTPKAGTVFLGSLWPSACAWPETGSVNTYQINKWILCLSPFYYFSSWPKHTHTHTYTQTYTHTPQFLRNCKAFFKEKYVCMSDKLLQSCLTLSHPMACSPPASAVHGILLTHAIKSTSYISCVVRQVLYC